MTQASAELGRNPRDSRTLILARRIPTIHLGGSIGLTDEAFDQLKIAFAEIDREAEFRGIKVPVPA